MESQQQQHLANPSHGVNSVNTWSLLCLQGMSDGGSVQIPPRLETTNWEGSGEQQASPKVQDDNAMAGLAMLLKSIKEQRAEGVRSCWMHQVKALLPCWHGQCIWTCW
jgi:hypothetical protein